MRRLLTTLLLSANARRGGRGGGRFALHALDGTAHRVTSVRVRGRGCAASARQSRDFPLVQIIARAPSGGTQAFIDGVALNRASTR